MIWNQMRDLGRSLCKTWSAGRIAHRARRRSSQASWLEGLESRVLLAAVTWDGGGSDLQWSNPLNWSGDALPGPTDDVTISVPGDVTILHSGGSTSVRSLLSDESLSLVAGTLSVSAVSEVRGSFTTGLNSTLVVSGSSAVFRATSVTALGTSNLLATGGGVIELPNALSYSGGGDGGTALRAIGAGSRLDLSGITTLSGFGRHGQVDIEARSGGVIQLPGLLQIPTGTTRISAFEGGSEVNVSSLETWFNSNFARSSSVAWGQGGVVHVDALRSITSVSVTASTGDTLNFPALSHLAGYGDSSATLLADGVGSRIEFPVLSTRDTSNRHGQIDILARNGGVIDMPQLVAMTEGTTTLTATGPGSVINVSALETWFDSNFARRSSVTWGHGGVVRVDSLRSMTSVSVTANTGDTLSFPALTRISGYGDSSATILAEGIGSRIEFPVLTSGDGINRHGQTDIIARSSGVIDMPELTTITDGTTTMSASGAGSEINVSALETWHNSNFARSSSITWGMGGVVQVDSLRTITSVSVMASAGETLVFPSLTRIAGVGDSTGVISATGAGSRLEFPAVIVIDGPERHGDISFQARNGGVINLPVATSVEHGAVNVSAFDTDDSGNPSRVLMPALTTWTNNSPFRDSYIRYGRQGFINLDQLTTATALSVYATDGDTVRLPALQTYIRSWDGGPYLAATGVGSRLELPQLSAITGENRNGVLHIDAMSGGVINLPVLTSLSGGTTHLLSTDSGSRIEMPVLESWTLSGRQPFTNFARAVNTAEIRFGQNSAIAGIQLEASSGGEVEGGLLTLNSGTLLTGDSVIRADVRNASGTVAPGSSTRRLTIDGDFTNTATGTVAIELAGLVPGSSHDQLVVTGHAELDGILNVTRPGGYLPVSGEAFEVLQFGSRHCDFLTKTGLDLGNGLYLAAAFDADSMTLNAGSIPDAGQQCDDTPLDEVAPTSVATRSVEPNTGGWNNSDVMISLSAVDSDGGTGVASLHYSINGGPEQSVAGSSHQFLLSADGIYTISYRAIDVAGNQELPKSLTVRIDRSGPVVVHGGPYAVVEGNSVAVDGSGSSDALSGIAEIAWSLENDNSFATGAVASWFAPDGPFLKTVTLRVTDVAGNVTYSSTEIAVQNAAPIVIPAAFTVAENSPNGTSLGTIAATDVPADSITWSITGGSGATAFAIDPQTGILTVADATQLDYETNPILTLVVTATDEDGASGQADVTILLQNLATLSGVVFVDTDHDGQFEANEPGIDGVTIHLLNEAGDVLFSTVTDDGGLYFFEDVPAGTWQIQEVQPSGVADGPEQTGTLGGTLVANDLIQLTVFDQDAAHYNFSEYGLQLGSGDTAGIGFWQNKHGQDLITRGGTALAEWLTTQFPNVFGNEFQNADGADVAAFYKNQLFRQKGKNSAGPARVDAQFMATAFAVFFTSRTLAGDVAQNFGFHVSDTGIGTCTINVGSRGAAFLVEDHSEVTVLQLLLAVNVSTSRSGSGFTAIYDQNGDGLIDSRESWLRTLANELFSEING